MLPTHDPTAAHAPDGPDLPIPGLGWLVSMLAGTIALTLAALLTSGAAPSPGADAAALVPAARPRGAVRAFCVAPTPQPLVDTSLSAVTYCPFGATLAFAASNTSGQPLYARIIVFAQGSTATWLWPPGPGATQQSRLAGGGLKPLGLQLPLRTSGATVVAMLSPAPITDQHLRSVARRVSSGNAPEDDATITSWSIEATGTPSLSESAR